MKICMIGLGSIGKKHSLNVSFILRERGQDFVIDALRFGTKELTEDMKQIICREYHNYEELPSDYDIIFVTNPTSKHFETIQRVKYKTKAMFIEKPLFEQCAYSIKDLNLYSIRICYVACPLRYKPILQYVKSIVEQGESIYAVRAISTSYLPEWRQGIDYRTVYSAKSELGGGVTLDLIHEWDYLTYIFGMPEKVYNIKGQYSDLEIDCDDISVYIAEYQDKTVEVHLDYIGREPERKLELYCKEYRINIDLLNDRIEYCGKEKREILFEPDDIYRKEMRYFLDVIEGKKENENTIEHAERVLRLVLNEKDKQGEI